MKLNKQSFAIIAVILSTTIWGANATIMKYTLDFVPPFSLGFIRFFGASLIFLPFLFKRIKLKDLSPTVIVTGLIGITGTLSLYFLGLRLTTALNAGVITSFSPLLTLLGAHILLSERTKRNVLVGAAIGLLGIGIIIGKDFSRGVLLSPLGDFLILISIFGSVFYSIFSKKISKNLSPILTTFYVLAIGAIGFIPGAIWEWQTNPNWIGSVPKSAFFGILFAIIFSSFIAHSFWQWGLSKMDAAKIGIFNYLEPIVTTITAVIILSEKITLPFIIGSIFIFAGLLIAEVHRHSHPPHHR